MPFTVILILKKAVDSEFGAQETVAMARVHVAIWPCLRIVACLPASVTVFSLPSPFTFRARRWVELGPRLRVLGRRVRVQGCTCQSTGVSGKVLVSVAFQLSRARAP